MHGLEPKVGNGFVQVKVYRQEGCICIDTVDDGVGFGMDGEAAKDNAHNHVGLSNVHHMIQLMYGEAYGVTVFSSPGRGSTVRIRIPENAGASGKAEDSGCAGASGNPDNPGKREEEGRIKVSGKGERHVQGNAGR